MEKRGGLFQRVLVVLSVQLVDGHRQNLRPAPIAAAESRVAAMQHAERGVPMATEDRLGAIAPPSSRMTGSRDKLETERVNGC
jgi:hypothetical protein